VDTFPDLSQIRIFVYTDNDTATAANVKMDYALWIELILFIVLLGLSGFFSSSETSLFSLSSTQREQMRREGNPRVGLIERLLSEPRRLIVTILIGNELVNVTASVLSAAAIIQILGADSKWVNLFVMVPLLLLVGEITPKNLAIRNNVAFASAQCRLIDLFANLIKPVRLLVRQIADWFTTLIVGKERSKANIVTEDMVRTLAHEAVGEGALDHHEAEFIDQILDFGGKTVAAVMTPRSDVFFLPVDTPLPQIVAEFRRTRRSRVPLYTEHRDQIVGILHARDLLNLGLNGAAEKPVDLQSLLREPYFVPESKPAADLFHTFRKRRLSFALTVDEYGGVTGLVTMEDLLECIFGAIPSPSDSTRKIAIEELGDGRYAVDGGINIDEFNRRTGSRLIADTAETLGGLLLHEYGELPPEGTCMEIDEKRFELVEISENRIKRIIWENLATTRDAGEAVTSTAPPDASEPTTDPARTETSEPPPAEPPAEQDGK
jgi:putative hemolysin